MSLNTRLTTIEETIAHISKRILVIEHEEKMKWARISEILTEIQTKITKFGLDLEQNKHHIVTLQQYYLEYIKPSTEEDLEVIEELK